MSVFAFRYKTASKNMAANNASLESYGATDSAQDFDLARDNCKPILQWNGELGNQRVKTCFNPVRRQPTNPWKAAVKSSSPLSKGTDSRQIGQPKAGTSRDAKERKRGPRSPMVLCKKRWQCLRTSSLPWMCYPTKRNQVVRTVASLARTRLQINQNQNVWNIADRMLARRLFLRH